MQVNRWIVGFDLHWPRSSRPTCKAMFKLIDAIRPTGIILAGDQMDNECISHHTKGKSIYRPQGKYLQDQNSFETEFLTPLEGLLEKGCKKVWIVGNHDHWERQYIEENPELDGLLDRPRGLKLKQRGWEVIDIGGYYRLGKMVVCHGEWLTGMGNQGGQFPAKKAVEAMSSNVLAGHTHAPQSFTRIAPVDKVQKWMGWISPILGATNASFMRNRPNAWLSGFTMVEVMDDGAFNCYPIIVTKGRFSYGGKVWDAR